MIPGELKLKPDCSSRRNHTAYKEWCGMAKRIELKEQEGYIGQENTDSEVRTDCHVDKAERAVMLRYDSEDIRKEDPDMTVRIKTIEEMISRAIMRKSLRENTAKEKNS